MCKKEWVWGQRNIHFYAFVWGVCLVFILPFPLNNFDCMGKKKSTKPSHIFCFNKSYFNCVSSNGFWRWECTQVPDRAVTLRGDADPIPRYSILLAPLLLQWMEIEVWAIFVVLVGLWAIQNAALPLMMATALPLTVRPGSRWVPSLQTPHPVSSRKPQMFFPMGEDAMSNTGGCAACWTSHPGDKEPGVGIPGFWRTGWTLPPIDVWRNSRLTRSCPSQKCPKACEEQTELLAECTQWPTRGWKHLRCVKLRATQGDTGLGIIPLGWPL